MREHTFFFLGVEDADPHACFDGGDFSCEIAHGPQVDFEEAC
jgi:hypothetical protein